jgi:hypothetical protein
MNADGFLDRQRVRVRPRKDAEDENALRSRRIAHMCVHLRSSAVAFVLVSLTTLPAASVDEHFELRQIATRGRTVAAALADFDGDSHTDLLQVVFEGIPPRQRRLIRLHSRVAAGGAAVDVALPDGAAGYDLADLPGSPGTDLVLLRQNDLLVVSFAGEKATTRSLAVTGPGTIGPRGEERNLRHMDLVYEVGPERFWLIVQHPGQLTVLTPEGRQLGQLAIGGVVNYFHFERPGIGFAESPIELNYVPALISVAKVDGDDGDDIVAATRHGVRVFLQRPDGTFAAEPDRDLPLALISEGDYIRGSGGATAEARDLDGDGLADLMVSYVTGGLTDAATTATIHRNRGGRWNLEQPDQTLHISDRGSLTLVDLDGDRRSELIRMTTPFSAMELIEALATRSLDLHIAIFRAATKSPLEEKPWIEHKLSVPISFETFAPRGFLPNWKADLNGDGHRDMVTAGDGEEIEVYLGGPEFRYDRRVARQPVGSSGQLVAGDIDDDGRTDLVLWDPHRVDAAVKLLRNRGTLPGGPKVLQPAK